MKIVLDIETVQHSKEEWAALKGVGLLAADDLLNAGDAAEQDREYEKSCFDPTFCRIVCIGALFFTDTMEAQEATAWYGSNEKELLRQFWERMKIVRPTLFVTHNGLSFDLPFLKNRSIVHQVKPPFDINLAKFRTDPVFDTMSVWSNWEMRGRVKLDVLARVLNTETKSGSGKQVADMWSAGQGKEIAEYCLQDCYVTYACYSRMSYREPMPSERVLAKKDLIELNDQAFG